MGTGQPRAEDTPTSTAIRVLLVDDQPLFRRAIAALIDEQPGFTVVGEAADGRQAVELARTLGPDVVVMDVEMPVMNGVEAVRILRDEQPGVKIVVLTVSESEDYLFDAIRFGAHGYLLKDLRPEQLYEMLRGVMRDETPLSPAIAGRLLNEVRRTRGAAADAAVPPAQMSRTESPDVARTMLASESVLTRRELETLELVADGLSNKEIGARLSITEGTVKNHVHNALEKLQLENRIQAAAYVVRQGLGTRQVTD
ncbi:MAG TPA: response regulator transcription factor [Candidatus Limnocylindrales bacterium]